MPSVCVSYGPAVSADCFFARHIFSFLVSSHGENKKVPHVRFIAAFLTSINSKIPTSGKEEKRDREIGSENKPGFQQQRLYGLWHY